MLKTIAQEYKFNIIRIYPAWTYYNPAPDRFDFTDLEEVLKYCDEFGLRVLMGVVIEEAPYWLEELHPETRFVDAKGNFQRLSDSGNNVSGGWPGLCLDWDPVQKAAARFIEELASMAAQHPSMYAYDCWNEPHLSPAFPAISGLNPKSFFTVIVPRRLKSFIAGWSNGMAASTLLTRLGSGVIRTGRRSTRRGPWGLIWIGLTGATTLLSEAPGK